jgi:hypothetical protein
MKRLYALLLYLFPSSYRHEYGDELQAVFDLSLDAARNQGIWVVLRLILRELIELPGALIYEHLRYMRRANMIDKLSSYFDFTYGSWKEFFIALFPFFLVCFAMPLLNYLVRLGFLPLTNKVGPGVLLALLGLFVILLILGLIKGLPRWALPYLGFVCSLLSVYVFSILIMGPVFLVFPRIFDGLYFLGDFLFDGALWIGLLLIVISMGLLNRQVPAFHQFGKDWTLLSFVVYGALPWALLLTYDEYVGDEPYTVLAFLVLAGGAWFYLRSSGQWKRFGALFGALILVLLITAVSKAILMPSQTWPFEIDSGLLISEIKHTIIMWMWLALTMLVPSLISLFPRDRKPTAMAPPA